MLFLDTLCTNWGLLGLLCPVHWLLNRNRLVKYWITYRWSKQTKHDLIWSNMAFLLTYLFLTPATVHLVLFSQTPPLQDVLCASYLNRVGVLFDSMQSDVTIWSHPHDRLLKAGRDSPSSPLTILIHIFPFTVELTPVQRASVSSAGGCSWPRCMFQGPRGS